MIGKTVEDRRKKPPQRAHRNELVAYSSERYLQPYYLATIHAALGERDESIRWLTRGLRERSHLMVLADVDAALDPVRDDSRFREIIHSVGLTP